MHSPFPRLGRREEKAPYLAVCNMPDDESTSESGLLGYDVLQAPELSTTAHRRRPRCTAIAVLVTVLVAIVATETVLLFQQIPSRHPWPVPDFPLHETRFERQLDWEFSPAARDLWAGVIPNSGLIAIRHPEDYGLLPGLHTSAHDSQVYGVVVTHEFHCLRMVRESFFGLVTRDPRYLDELYATNASVVLPPGKLNHLFHCMDYLRQMILCRADTTLEWQSQIDSRHIDGYGPPHQCRSWNDVHAWMSASLPPEPKYRDSPVT